MKRYIMTMGLLVLGLAGVPILNAGKDDGIKVDKAKKTISIDAKIAPRKLPNLKEVYPIEVIACWAHPKGKKAHETVVTFEANPSAIHKALEDLGLRAGAPLMGEGKEPPKGPDVLVYLEVVDDAGATRKLTPDKMLVDSRTGKPFPKNVKFRFTGSVFEQPDPNKKDKVYGADLSGTLMVIFPVTNQTVLQTNLTMEYERFMKLETNTKTLPKEGTPVKLVIEVPQ